MKTYFIFFLSFFSSIIYGQNAIIRGQVMVGNQEIPFAQVGIPAMNLATISDENGVFLLSGVEIGRHLLLISAMGYIKKQIEIEVLYPNQDLLLNVELVKSTSELQEVVVTGTLKEVSKAQSIVPVEMYQHTFFSANKEPSLIESIGTINGLRPQVNCNVCNTSDIRINGMDGPYTMVLIDGMPIVSGLSTQYGLFGIPQSMIERVEVVKGPASTLYGSEAMGGVINVITKKPEGMPIFDLDVYMTSRQAFHADMAFSKKLGSLAQTILGINYYHFQNPYDLNHDGFTDASLQERFSVFNKWIFERESGKLFSIAGRYVYEDRWGGQTNWTPKDRGGDLIYGESIFTNRWELFGVYEMNLDQDMYLQFSANGHEQNSVYGTTMFHAKQYVGFGQWVWGASLSEKIEMTSGSSVRYLWYDDNSLATIKANGKNAASVTLLPGVFTQVEWDINRRNAVLLGLRMEYSQKHRSIVSPRFNYMLTSRDKLGQLRISAGNGYRVVNVFTEDHAALTGAREVVFEEALKPETSWNLNASFNRKLKLFDDLFLGIDLGVFYNYFNNRIIPDYESNSNQIRYGNLDGYAELIGMNLAVDATLPIGLSLSIGASYMDAQVHENERKYRPLFSERFAANWRMSYAIAPWGIEFNYNGSLYSPMRLPLLSHLDERDEYSPWWGLHNIQVSKSFAEQFSMYAGIKNLLNFKLPTNTIARAHDPFDNEVDYNQKGEVLPTPENPQALTFDPSYGYAPNDGMRLYIGLRFHID